MVVAPGGGNGYRRSMIRTLDPAADAPYYSWLGQGQTPVTYSLTIASYPADRFFFQSHIFLVPNGGNDASVDYNAATVMALDIRNRSDGTAAATFRYKTNHAYANAADFQPATLVCSNGVLGAWSMTFRDDNDAHGHRTQRGHDQHCLAGSRRAAVQRSAQRLLWEHAEWGRQRGAGRHLLARARQRRNAFT